MSVPPEISLNAGSRWHRWDPHIHAPGTILNDQFKGAGTMDAYIEALNKASPPIRALGITDYYLLDTYEAVRVLKAVGRLPHCGLIFPNIELRLGLQTNKGRFIDLHLLVCPDDQNHVEETKRFLGQLTFDAVGDTFSVYA